MKNFRHLFHSILMLFMFVSLNAAQAQDKHPMPFEKEPHAMEKKAVRQVVTDLFDAMRAGDGEKVASLFVDDAILQRAGKDRDGNPGLSKSPASGFAEAVGKPHDEVWDERVWDIDIKVDGRLASVWMSFAFYLGDSFRHCGVNSMQMFKSADGWKIIYLADTSRQSACEIPEHIKSGGN